MPAALAVEHVVKIYPGGTRGRLLQIGSAEELKRRPADPDVARDGLAVGAKTFEDSRAVAVDAFLGALDRALRPRGL